MSKKTHDNFTFLSIVVVGFFALVALTIYLSSKGALPPLTGINLDEVVNIVNSVSSTTMAASQASTTSPMSTNDGKNVIEAPLGNIDIELAGDEISRENGLSGRTSLGADKGMLFTFIIPGRYGFWMEDMNFPIDIVWIDADHKVVGMNANVQPSSYPDTFFPPQNISYVLEINAGAAKELGIKVGEILKFNIE
ncbi:MAG: DUF192 domain-containing protein [Candidatus Taylorbacteria bacterium]